MAHRWRRALQTETFLAACALAVASLALAAWSAHHYRGLRDTTDGVAHPFHGEAALVDVGRGSYDDWEIHLSGADAPTDTLSVTNNPRVADFLAAQPDRTASVDLTLREAGGAWFATGLGVTVDDVAARRRALSRQSWDAAIGFVLTALVVLGLGVPLALRSVPRD